MRWTYTLCALFILSSALLLRSYAAPDESITKTVPVAGSPKPTVEAGDLGAVLSILWYYETGPDKKKDVIASPAIYSIAGSDISLNVGGTIKSKAGGNALEIGLRLAGRFDQISDSEYMLTLKMARGHEVDQAKDTEIDLVQTDTIELRLQLQDGQSRRIRCSDSRWCELKIDRIKQQSDFDRLLNKTSLDEKSRTPK